MFGVFFAVFMSSLQQGSLENMVDNMVRFYTGYIQIQEKDFNETPSVNHSFSIDKDLGLMIADNPHIIQSTQRIQTFALAGSETASFPSLVLGIKPDEENTVSGVSKWLSEGTFLQPNTTDILIGKVLADNLKVSVGDSLVLIGQGYHGISATGLYRIGGLLDFPLPDLSKQVVYMSLATCQDFAGLQNKITNAVLMVQGLDDVEKTIKELKPVLDENLAIYAWDDLQPELQNLIEGKLASGKVIKMLLFMVIGFGVWATIIMLMNERRRELGVMIAIGFRKTKAVIMIIIESFFIGLIGVISGIVVSFPLVWYLYRNPIYVTGKMAETYRSMGFEPVFKFSIDSQIFLSPAITVFAIFALISMYQVYYVLKLKTVDAIRT